MLIMGDMGDISESPGGWTFELWQEGAEAVFNLPEMQAHGKSQVPWMFWRFYPHLSSF